MKNLNKKFFIFRFFVSIMVFGFLLTYCKTVLKGGYVKDGDKILFYASPQFMKPRKSRTLKNVDVSSFVVLEKGFAKDKNKAYFQGYEIQQSDAASFEYIEGLYAKDKNHVYLGANSFSNDPQGFEIVSRSLLLSYYSKDSQFVYQANRRIEEADPKSFSQIKGKYYRDKNHVFYSGKKIVGADPLTFEVLNEKYAKDKNHVFYIDVILQGADPQSFEWLQENYSRDKQHVYLESFLLPDSDAQTFEILEGCYSRDAKQVYFCEHVVSQDPKHFEFIKWKNRILFGKDSKSVYNRQKRLEGADPETFTIVSEYYAKDKKGVWYLDVISFTRIENTDFESFVALDRYYSKDKNHVYYKDEILQGADVATFRQCQGKPASYWVDKNQVYLSGKPHQHVKKEECL